MTDPGDRLGVAVDQLKHRWPDLLAIYRFGSSQTPAQRPDSDVDLAVLAKGPLETGMVWQAAQSLASLLGKDVDLLDLRRASTVMRARVVTQGERLHCGDRGQCDAFEAHALSDYALLNEERAAILSDIKARGTVYGG